MSSFLDWLGEDPDTGEQPIRSLAIYDSREGHDVNVSPDQIYENRTSRKLAWQKGLEPVTVKKTDPLSEFCEVIPERSGDGENGKWTMPPQFKVNMMFHFDDPDSPNAGRDYYHFAEFPATLDEDSPFAKSDLKKRKGFMLFLASFLQTAEVDLSTVSGGTSDEDLKTLWDLFCENVDSFEDQQVWLSYQVGWWLCKKDSKNYTKGEYYLSEKPLRVTAG